MRLIDANALSESIKHGAGTNLQKFFADVCVIAAPTVDAVSVIYCKDCKYRTEFGSCGHPRQQGILPTAYPYDFCSYGDRKDEANES